jgi:hypothetical protein
MLRSGSWLCSKDFCHRLLAGLILFAALFVGPVSRATSVRLAWDPNPEPDVAGYRVYYGSQPGIYPQVVDAGNATSAEVTGLVAGVPYYLSVTAYNSLGIESGYSEPLPYRAPQAPSRAWFVGLIGEGESGGQASFRINVGATGKATGSLKLGGKLYAVKGVFSQEGIMEVTIRRKAGLGDVTLLLTLTDAGAGLIGSLTDGSSLTGVNAKRAELVKGPVKSVHRGRYTAFLAPPDPQHHGGYGYASVNVAGNGTFRLAATLPDGLRCTYSGPIDDTASVPVHIFLAGGKGSIFGRIHLRDVANESDADGQLTWINGGLESTDINFRAGRYAAQPGGAALNGASLSLLSATQVASETTLNQTVPNAFIATASGGEIVNLKVTNSTGMFAGSSLPLGGKAQRFGGIVYQKGALRGFGRLREVTNPGSVEITAAPSL